MTTYNSQTTVSIAGTNYSGSTLRGVRIVNGRNNLQEQPLAGYANIEIFSDWNTALTFDVNESVVVSIYNPVTASQEAIFTGKLSEVIVDVRQSGNQGGIAIYSILALGALASLSRKTAGSALSFDETDPATMIEYWVSEAFAITWEQLGTQTWNDLGTATWQDLLFAEQVGTFEPTNWNCDWTMQSRNALELCQLGANSALGVLYEKGDGTINFYGSNYRDTLPQIAINANAIEPDITSALRVGELITECITQSSLGYNSPYIRATSIIDYGVYTADRETLLSNTAEYLATGILQTEYQSFSIISYRSVPYMYPDRFTIELANDVLTNAQREDYMQLFVGSKLNVTDLPATLYTGYANFVEGIEWRLTDKLATLTLTVSDSRLDIIA